MTTRHYHVGENVPGYLPESDPVTFTSRRHAVRYAYAQARDIRDSDLELDPWDRRHRSIVGSDGNYHIVGPGHDLGIHVWTIACDDTACAEG